MKGVILIDSREQVNGHITKKLDSLGILYKTKKLDFADYSFQIGDTGYENKIVIERKNSIDELIGNITKGKERFRREFERSKGCKVVLMVEASESQIDRHEYRSRMSPSDFKKCIKMWCYKYQLELKYIEKDKAAEYMLQVFRNYYVKEVKQGWQKEECLQKQ
jgi:ERCC4-type nuclease